MNKDSHKTKVQLLAELAELRKKSKEKEDKLKVVNQQLDASNQQLDASNQQLLASNQQLEASNLEIRKRETEALEAKEYAENIIKTLREPLLILDEDLKVITANESFYKTFKVSQKASIGSSIFKLGNHQWDIPKLKKLLLEILPDKSQITDFEVEHYFEDIGQKTMMLNSKELIQEAGKKRLILLAIEDITEQKLAKEKLTKANKKLEAFNQQLDASNQQLEASNQQLEASNQQLEASNQQLKVANQSLQDMVYVTSHDLQVPLVSMQGFASEVLASQKDKLDEEGVYCLTRLQSNVERMHKLVLSLLDISRLNTHTNPYQKFNLKTLLKKITKDISLTIEENKATVNFENLPTIYADKQRIESVLRNLLTNALNYEAKQIDVTFNNGILAVTDDGIGVPQTELKKIFFPGERLKMNNAEGVGMGLAFCEKVVKKHQGSIWATSKGLNKGTTINIQFNKTTLKT